MKRMAVMRQKKFLLNDFIRIKKKEMLAEQERIELVKTLGWKHEYVDSLPNIQQVNNNISLQT